jgi:glycosyltransferase involved in cell wall biosynthesis
MYSVLQIIDFAAPYKGNFIASLEFLRKELLPVKMIYLMPQNALDITWIKEFIDNGNKVYFIERSFFSKKISWANLRVLFNICKREQIGIIHTHFIHYNLTLFAFKLIYPVKIVSHLHNHYASTGFRGIIKTIVFKKTSDLFIGVSNSVAGEARIIIKTKRVVCSPNAIDFVRLNQSSGIPPASPGTKNILLFGWPYRRKGLDIAIRAISELVGRGINIQLNVVLAGGIDIVTNEILKEFNHVPHFLVFLPPREDVATYFNSCDILLSSSREEGFNYTLVEGAYCNCLIISSNIKGIPGDIPFIKLFESENSKTLSLEIENLIGLSDQEKLIIKEKQREYVINNFSLEFWAKSIIDCYKNLGLEIH